MLILCEFDSPMVGDVKCTTCLVAVGTFNPVFPIFSAIASTALETELGL